MDDMIPVLYGEAEGPLTGSFVVYDTETTGLDPQSEALTEIGAVVVENGQITRDLWYLCKPWQAHSAQDRGAYGDQRRHGGGRPDAGRSHSPVCGFCKGAGAHCPQRPQF